MTDPAIDCLEEMVRAAIENRRPVALIVRAEAFKSPREPYTSLSYIEKELQHFRRMCAARGWRMVEVTVKSVEEAAHEIIVLRGQR